MKPIRLFLFAALLLGTAAAFRPWGANRDGHFRAMGHEGKPSARAMPPPPYTELTAIPIADTTPEPARPKDEPAPADGNLTYNFTDLGKATRNADNTYAFPESITKSDGKTVSIRGFMVPYDSLEDMSVFMLMQVSSGCFFCEPPSLNQVVIVHQKKGNSKTFIEDPIRITGTFRVWNKDSQHPDHQAGFLYVMDDTTVEKMKSDLPAVPSAPAHNKPHP